jgi:hypothetical protein
MYDSLEEMHAFYKFISVHQISVTHYYLGDP